MQKQPPILLHRDAKSPNFYNNDPRSFKHHCKLDKILRTFVSIIVCDFQLFLGNTQVYVALHYPLY